MNWESFSIGVSLRYVVLWSLRSSKIWFYVYAKVFLTEKWWTWSGKVNPLNRLSTRVTRAQAAARVPWICVKSYAMKQTKKTKLLPLKLAANTYVKCPLITVSYPLQSNSLTDALRQSIWAASLWGEYLTLFKQWVELFFDNCVKAVGRFCRWTYERRRSRMALSIPGFWGWSYCEKCIS